MSDLRNMSREFLTEFIELYREHSCLWRIKSKEYSDRNKKNCAYEKLIEKLKEVDANASKETVIKKINTIRGCFRKEHKKVVASLKSGAGEEDVYHPHLWYYELLVFLQDHETLRCSRSNIQEDDEINSEVLSDTQEVVSVDLSSPDNTENNPSAEKDNEQSIPSTSRTVTPLRSKRPRPNPVNVSNKTDEILTFIGHKLQNEEAKADEFDAVGNNVACKLRRLPKEMRIFAEKLINDVMFYAELGRLNEYTAVTNPHPCPSGPSGLTAVPRENNCFCCQRRC